MYTTVHTYSCNLTCSNRNNLTCAITCVFCGLGGLASLFPFFPSNFLAGGAFTGGLNAG